MVHVEEHYPGPRAIGKCASNLRVYFDENSSAHEPKVHASNTPICPGPNPGNAAPGNSINDTHLIVTSAYICGGKPPVIPGTTSKKT